MVLVLITAVSGAGYFGYRSVQQPEVVQAIEPVTVAVTQGEVGPGSGQRSQNFRRERAMKAHLPDLQDFLAHWHGHPTRSHADLTKTGKRDLGYSWKSVLCSEFCWQSKGVARVESMQVAKNVEAADAPERLGP